MAKNFINFCGETFYTPNVKMNVKDEPISPNEEFNSSEDNDSSMKKSLSMSDINAFRRELLKLETACDNDREYRKSRKPMQTGCMQNLQQSKAKFVSLAEAVYHFQKDTPSRFRTTRHNTFCPQNTAPAGLTRPQSPTLRCKQRSRPVHVMTQQEKEELELEEIRKFKIKANPIPKSVNEVPNLPVVPRKPKTIPEPFKLTVVHKRTATPEPKPQFKAKPAPKHILEKPQIPPKVPVLKSAGSRSNHRRSKSHDQLYQGNAKPLKAMKKQAESKKVQRLVTPEPFSFAQRDEEIKRRKEENIRKQIEEERKLANQFKAQPLSGVVRKVMQKSKGSSSTTSSENKENCFKFEARPPTVLHKEPFKPVLKPIQVKQSPFELMTEIRAEAREKFDKHLKEKEKEQEKRRKQKEKELEENNAKQMAQLRATLVHRAKPLVQIDPFIPDKTEKKVTIPQTPEFIRRRANSQKM